MKTTTTLIINLLYATICMAKPGDTINLARYNVNPKNADNAKMINAGIQAAIQQKASVVVFPSAGVYHVKSSNYWTIPNGFKLQIDGRGAIIEVDREAASAANETYVMAFRCSDINSINSSISIKRINIRAPGIKPQWANTNFKDHVYFHIITIWY